MRNPDEGRYAEIAREMVVTGNWLSPTLCGVSYLRKPPLFYWVTAFSFKLFGFSEFSARLAPALSSLLVILMVFLFSQKYFGSRTACFASLILLTNLWFIQVGRFALIDSLFTLFLTACFFSFFNSLGDARNKLVWKVICYFSLSAAFLTKGLVGVALPVLAVLSYAVLTRQSRHVLSNANVWLGSAIFASTAAPVYFLIEKNNPGFIQFFIVNEHVRRFISPDFEHQKAWHYYFFAIFLIFIPWLFFLRIAQASFFKIVKRSLNDPRFFLWVSVSAMILFLSLSRSKLPTYILPCIPLISILIAHGWSCWIDAKAPFGRMEVMVILTLFLLAIGVILSGAYILQTQRDGIFPVIGNALQLLGGVALTGCVLSWRALQRAQPSKLFYAIVMTLGLVTIFFNNILEDVNPSYTTKHFAAFLKGKLLPQDEVYVYDHPGPFYDFGFYLNRNVKLVGLEGELKHSTIDQNAGQAHITREVFFDRIKGGQRLYCLIRKSDFSDLNGDLKMRLEILKQDHRKVLFVSNPSQGRS